MSEYMYNRGGKIPSFDDEAKNFENWWKKFLAYEDILREIRDRNLPEEEMIEDNDGITKEQKVAIRKNK
jgi:hypothetical protein